MTKLRRMESAQEVPYIVSAGLEALDLLNIGVAVTNASRQLLFANQTAELILETRDGLELTDQNVLTLVGRSSGSSLSSAIQQSARLPQPGEQAPRDVVLAVRRASGRRPLTLMVRPLKSRASQPHDAAAPSVLVFIWDPELPVHDTETGLRQLFGFTSSEARLAHLLMEGNTVEDCCHHLEVRPSTVRMHLANLFAKTGVQRQGQLVSLLWKSVGMVRATHDVPALKESPAARPLETSSAAQRSNRLMEQGAQRDVAVRAVMRVCRL